MKFQLLQVVVLKRAVPEHGLQAGDVGTVVGTYEPDGVEVEFMTASGDTVAVLALSIDDLRPGTEQDMLSARPLSSRV